MSDESSSQAYDVFISHASEDKPGFVEPLVGALRARGLAIWYDRHEIGLGDDFVRKMNEGLGRSRFGVVVLSASFRKHWPEAELSALHNQEAVFGRKCILPVFHEVTDRQVAEWWPLLGARLAARSGEGPEQVAERIAREVCGAPSSSAGGGLASPLCNVPDPSQTFIGREPELRNLEDALSQGSACLAASLEGLAGVGKTELAIQLAHRLAERGEFPGGIYWFDAEDGDLTAVWATKVADHLQVPRGDPGERARAAVGVLTRKAVPLLVILDNVASWRAGVAPTPLPEGRHVRRLVTTRRRKLGGATFRHVELEVLPPEAARELLLKTADRALEDADGLDALLEHLDGHTLAIELAGAFLDEYPDESPADYLGQLGRAEASPNEEVADRVRYEATVRGALGAVWSRLDPAARGAWCLAACFAPEPVSTELSESCGLDRKARRALRDRHLITDSGRTWRMHRLVQDFGRRHGDAGEERAAAQVAFVEGCVARTSQIDVDLGFHIYGPDRAHFDRALEMTPTDEDALWMLHNRIGMALKSAGDYAGAKDHLEAALSSNIARCGPAHPSVATSRSNLALVLQDLGDLSGAKEHAEAALSSNLASYGPAHPSVATSRSNLALVLKDLGDLSGAKEHLEAALSSDLASYGPAHPSVAIRRSNLARVLQDLGDLVGAKEHLEAALSSNLASYGPAHPSVATSRSNLALALQDLGDLMGAKRHLEAALSSNLASYGPVHPRVANGRSNLATVLRSLGDLSGAKEHLEAALSSDLARYGPAHRNVATCRSNLATVLHSLGDLSGAKRHLEAALSSDLASYGPAHPNVATSRSNLALVLKDLGDLSGAKEHLEAALSSDLASYGPAHPKVATCRSNLATVLDSLGDLSGAKGHLEAALSSDLASYGPAHPKVATRRSNLATVLRSLGDLSGAKEHLEAALSSDLEGYGSAHPSVATCRSNLALVLQDVGDLMGAKGHLEAALSSDLASYGSAHPKVAICRSNLATVLHSLGDLSGAKEHLEAALSSNLASYGSAHPSVSTCRSNLALVLRGLGDLSGAKEHLEAALSSSLANYGPAHPSVATYRSNLATVLHSLGDLSGAKEHLEAALSSDFEGYGPAHPKVAIRRSSLARVLAGLGDVSGAREQAQEAVRIALHLPEGSSVRAAILRAWPDLW